MRQPKILSTLKTYDKTQFLADLIAGITVAMVALPLSLAIAIASGASPSTGIVTAVVAGFIISALGGSRVQIGGPTGAFIVVVFGVIANHGYDGLVIATFMAGILLLIAGYFRIGNLISHIPEAVVNGFTIGIAIIIATSQLKDFLGLKIEELPADFVEKVPLLLNASDSLSLSSLMVALATMLLIVGARRIAPRFPGLVVAIALTSAGVYLFELPVETIQSRFGELQFGIPDFTLPIITFDRIIELFPSAVIIAFLAGIESLLSAMVADRMIAGHHRPNAELTAQGVANMASAFCGGLPATGAIARTATNIRAGGKTPVAGLVHAATIFLIMLLAAPLAGYMALPSLAALLILTAWNMSEPHRWGDYARSRISDRILLLITLGLTVLIDLTVAIGVGVAIGLALRIDRGKSTEDSDWKPPER